MRTEHHISRTWSGDRLERDCPCPKAPCGFVIQSQADPDCDQHPIEANRTMRRGHTEADCPGRAVG